jgi:hypothetical protein
VVERGWSITKLIDCARRIVEATLVSARGR